MMNDEQLLRYSRHILLNEWGIEIQKKLLDACAMIVGVGGLGSPVAMYLAAAGVGRLILVDDDYVSLDNLQRQILHTTETIGRLKTQSALFTLRKLNPTIVVDAIVQRADDKILSCVTSKVDVVIDCSDNFNTRHAVNYACVQANIPMVSGSAMGFKGQLSTFNTRNSISPCYACLFPRDYVESNSTCTTMGIFTPIVGIIGTLQAAEALRIISGIGQTMVGKVLIHDALDIRWKEISLNRDPYCQICAERCSKH